MKNKPLFLTATHGNEGFSKVFKTIEKIYPKNEYDYNWIIANEKAYKENKRFIEKDLNRSAPGNISSIIYEEKRAAEIIQMAKDYDFVIDIHGTKSSFGIVAIVPYPNLQNILLACMMSVDRIVIWHAKESREIGPLVQYISCPAIELECGPKDTEETAASLKRVIEDLLRKKDIFSIGPALDLAQDKELYVVYGKLTTGEKQQELEDFRKITTDNETFYPFMGKKEYKGISCYKMKKVFLQDLFIY